MKKIKKILLIIFTIIVLSFASFYIQARMKCKEYGYTEMHIGNKGVFCFNSKKMIIQPLESPNIVPMFYLGEL